MSTNDVVYWQRSMAISLLHPNDFCLPPYCAFFYLFRMPARRRKNKSLSKAFSRRTSNHCRHATTGIYNPDPRLFWISVEYRWRHCIQHANISRSMIFLVIEFAIPYKLLAPDAKTWVMVIEFFDERTLISRSHFALQSNVM